MDTHYKSHKKLWITLGLVLLGTFMILGWFGREVYRKAPPIPERVVTEGGKLLMTQDDILGGQQVYQSLGGMQVGSVWGHGAYQAPDWTADWLHREAVALLDNYAGGSVDRLPVERQAGLKERLRREMRRNTYDPRSGTVTVSAQRAEAMAAVTRHYDQLFGGDPALAGLRESYALHDTAVPDPARRQKLAAFFFWTAWAATTERPGLSVTYTNNWPHEKLVGNTPSTANLMWSIISIVLLIAGVGAPAATAPGMEGRSPALRLLVAQRRPGADDRAEPAAHRPAAGRGQHGARPVVRPQRRVPPAALAGDPALAAHGGRHRVPGRGGRAGLVRGGPQDRLVLRRGQTRRDRVGGGGECPARGEVNCEETRWK